MGHCARDYMATKLIVLSPELPILHAMRILLDGRVSGAPVVDAHGNLVGLLTQRDCLTVAYEASYYGDPAGTVADYMTREVDSVRAETSVVELIGRFFRSTHRRFPVMEGNQLVGMISRRDILRAVLELQ